MDAAVKRTATVATRESQKIAEQAEGLVIKNDEGLRSATEMLAHIRTIKKNIKAQKDPITKNLTATLKQVRELFRPSEDQLSVAESVVKSAMLKYEQKVSAAAAKKAEKIEAKVDAGEMELSDGMGKLNSIKQAPKSVATENGGAQFRTVKKIRITNVGDLPPSYFMRERVVEALRMEVAQDVLKEHKECPTGAELYEEKVVAGV